MGYNFISALLRNKIFPPTTSYFSKNGTNSFNQFLETMQSESVRAIMSFFASLIPIFLACADPTDFSNNIDFFYEGI